MAVEQWQRSLVLNQLRRADRDIADPGPTFAELRESSRLGHPDLLDVLKELKEDGTVEEDSGHFRLLRELGEEEVEEEEIPEELRPEEEQRGGETAAEPEAEPETPAPRPLPASDGLPVETVLTPTMATALTDEMLGQLVKAGIADAGDRRREFVLRIEG